MLLGLRVAGRPLFGGSVEQSGRRFARGAVPAVRPYDDAVPRSLGEGIQIKFDGVHGIGSGGFHDVVIKNNEFVKVVNKFH